MRSLLNILLFITLSSAGSYKSFVYGQTLGWVKTFGQAELDQGRDICIDSYGDVLTTGFCEGIVDFGPGVTLTGYGNEDVFISKHNSSGDLLWANVLGGVSTDTPAKIATDNERNVITIGSYRATADFDPGPGLVEMTAVDLRDIFISKLDANGNFLWSKSIGGVSLDTPSSVVVDEDRNIYIAGNSLGTVDADPGPDVVNTAGKSFVIKLNENGEFIWVKSFVMSGNSDTRNMEIDQSNNLFLTGVLSSNVDMDPGPSTFNLSPAGPLDFYVCKLDSSGSFLWAKSVGNVGGSSQCFTIDTDADGNVLLGGYFRNTVDFDPSMNVFNLTANGEEDAFILKLDSSGLFKWAKGFGGIEDDWLWDVNSDAYGNVYVTGEFKDTVDIDPGAMEQLIISSGWADMFITKLNSGGDYLWSAQISGTKPVRGWGITVGNSGEIYCTGDFMSTVDFEPAIGVFEETSYNTFGDAFVLRINPTDLGLSEKVPQQRTLERIVNLLGEESEDKPNTLLIHIYSDGTSEKVYKVE
jgi:hypothetical protein